MSAQQLNMDVRFRFDLDRMTINFIEPSKSTHHFELDDFIDTSHPTQKRLLEWARWTHRRNGQDFSSEIEAVEKAVGHLQFKPVVNPDPMLKAVIVAHYLEQKPLTTMAEDLGISEFHCLEYFNRAVRILAGSIPAWDRVLT